jgi:uncharacterized membrane protein YbhN (UPF0104 family)
VTDAPTPRTRWQRLGRVAVVIFLLAVAVLLVRYFRALDWREVGRVIAAYDGGTLAAGAALAVVSYALYAGYDVMARRYTGHALPTGQVLAIAAVSYAFNLNLGALVGGAGFRFRLYSRYGLDAPTITRILAFCVTTNWLGYMALAGAVFATRNVEIPPGWHVGADMLQAIGGGLLVAVAVYLVGCARWRNRDWTLRGQAIRLPSVRMALLQIAVAAANWSVIATIVWVLLHRQVELGTMLTVVLMAAIAGAMTHVPGGLGVIEVVVLTMLDERLSQHELVAALVVYRAIYYVLPLLIAAVTYGRLEANARRDARTPR